MNETIISYNEKVKSTKYTFSNPLEDIGGTVALNIDDTLLIKDNKLSVTPSNPTISTYTKSEIDNIFAGNEEIVGYNKKDWDAPKVPVTTINYYDSKVIRIPVNDTDYTVIGTSDQVIAFTAITSARIVYLPPAISIGQKITVLDESGDVTAVNRIKVVREGTDLIDGNSYSIQLLSYTMMEYMSNGEGQWSKLGYHDRLSAGVLVLASYTDNNDGSVTIGNEGLYNLFRINDGNGTIRSYEIQGDTFDLTDGATNYVVADWNNENPIIRVVLDVTLITETTIIPIYTIYRGGTRLHMLPWDHLGLALVNKMHQSIVKTQRYRLETGLVLDELPGRIVTVTEGAMWVGANRFMLSPFNSSINSLFFLYHSGGVWQPPSIVTQYNNTQYDDGTSLQTLNPNRYAVNYIYRGIEVEDECYMVLGGGNYTLLEAQGSLPPPNLPPIISSHAALVGRIIVEKTLTTAYQIDSIFSAAFALSSSVTHDNLANLSWISSGHTGTPNNIPAFGASGEATVLPTPPTSTSTSTLTNKRVQPRVYNTTTLGTLTPEISTYDGFELTAQAATLTIANHSTSTPAPQEKILIRIKDDGVARTINFGTYYRSVGTALPTTTVISKTMYLEFIWNSADTKWDLITLKQEI